MSYDCKCANTMKIDIYGFQGCGYADKAIQTCKEYTYAKVNVFIVKRDEWTNTLNGIKSACTSNKPMCSNLVNHKTSPVIFVNDVFIGGYTDLIERMKA